jgi:hypothetical protein
MRKGEAMNAIEQKMFYEMLGIAYLRGQLVGEAKIGVMNYVELAKLTGHTPRTYMPDPERLTSMFRHYYSIPQDEPVTESLAEQWAILYKECVPQFLQEKHAGKKKK